MKQDSLVIRNSETPMCDVRDADVYWLRLEGSGLFQLVSYETKAGARCETKQNA